MSKLKNMIFFFIYKLLACISLYEQNVKAIKKISPDFAKIILKELN